MHNNLPLAVGSAAPHFSTTDQNNQTLDLQKFAGNKNVVLYFYPKDNTPVCVVEAVEFSRLVNEFADVDTVIIGVSNDSLASHCDFIEKHNLQVKLAMDEDKAICNAYGVINDGGSINRWTFLIDKKGKIRDIWTKIAAVTHAKQVLEAVKNL